MPIQNMIGHRAQHVPYIGKTIVAIKPTSNVVWPDHGGHPIMDMRNRIGRSAGDDCDLGSVFQSGKQKRLMAGQGDCGFVFPPAILAPFVPARRRNKAAPFKKWAKCRFLIKGFGPCIDQRCV